MGTASASAEKLTIDPKNHVASVVKAARLLELFTSAEPSLGLATLVQRSGYSRTTTHRLLSTLELVGWLERSRDTYRLSLKVFSLGTAAVGGLELRHEASAVMSELSAQYGEDVYLVVPDGPRAVCLERIEGRAGVHVSVLDIGRSLPLFVGGGPVALLSQREDLLPSVLASGPMVTVTGIPITPDELRVRLAQTKERGYSLSLEDVSIGVGAFGAPVYNARGLAVAAISIGALIPSLTPPRREELVEALLTAAGLVSARLGYGA